MQGHPTQQHGNKASSDCCELCGRSGLELTKHHLIPRKRHRQASVRKKYPHAERYGRIAMLCRACHRTVHVCLTEKELEQSYNTVAALAGHVQIAKFVNWVKRQPVDRRVTVRRPNR
ncbi:MAG: hypothetical protein AAGH88_06355 [Planctomycetota bacterium]